MSAFDPKRTSTGLSQCRFEPVPCPVLSLGGADEATRSHHACRRRGGWVAARGECAADKGCTHWLFGSCLRVKSRGPVGSISGRAARSRLARRHEPAHRISLGGGQL